MAAKKIPFDPSRLRVTLKLALSRIQNVQKRHSAIGTQVFHRHQRSISLLFDDMFLCDFLFFLWVGTQGNFRAFEGRKGRACQAPSETFDPRRFHDGSLGNPDVLL